MSEPIVELKRQTTTNFLQAVLNPARVAALSRLGLLDTPAEAAFDKLGNLAAKLLHAPVALVSLVDDHRQFFKSCIGLPEPWRTWRDTPLSHSFCKHVVATAEPLAIDDARTDPMFRDNLAIRDIGVVAYLGIPLRTTSGHVLGSFCVIDSKPRHWTEEETATLTVLADCVMTEIELRSEITTRQAAQDELAAANEALRTFGSTVSHDLRAPLRHILNFARLLKESLGNVEGDAAYCLHAIMESATSANAMIEGIATLSQVSRRPLQRQLIDLTAMAKSVAVELQSLGGTPISFHVDPDLTANADAALMRVLLENLLSNAFKFSSRRPTPRVEFGAQRIRDQRVFYVKDNGIGFDEGEKSRLFTPFQRLSTARDYPGSGLGLQTAQRILERHGGTIWAESKPGDGATFFFTLPDAMNDGESEKKTETVTRS